MSLPRFHSRIANALGPLADSSGKLMTRLSGAGVTLEMDERTANLPAHVAGFLLAVNLCSRLYPRLYLRAPTNLQRQAAELALRINPACEIETSKSEGERLLWGGATPTESTVTVSADGWLVLLDHTTEKGSPEANPLTTLAAAALGVSELFRTVFKDFLPSGRTGPHPALLNLMTLDESRDALPELPRAIDLGTVHLAGVGAVGQAMLYALNQIPTAVGRLIAIDPETIALSNLQRYVLTMDSDVGMSKALIAQRTFAGRRLDIVPVETVWGADARSTSGVETVAVALDTAADRIGVQAGLPRAIYNGWTQPADLGWSRHESFGENEPCLACLYVPSGLRPSQHEMIARALQQPELRVLAYLTLRLPVDVALTPEQIPRLPSYPIPPSAPGWLERSILKDIVLELGVDPKAATAWKDKSIADLYREGICGGALVSERVGKLLQEVTVPLAHQSALAGIMLAMQLLVARVPELRLRRPAAIEGRFDVLSGLPQVLSRPRLRTPSCVCGDVEYVRRYRQKWPV